MSGMLRLIRSFLSPGVEAPEPVDPADLYRPPEADEVEGGPLEDLWWEPDRLYGFDSTYVSGRFDDPFDGFVRPEKPEDDFFDYLWPLDRLDYGPPPTCPHGVATERRAHEHVCVKCAWEAHEHPPLDDDCWYELMHSDFEDLESEPRHWTEEVADYLEMYEGPPPLDSLSYREVAEHDTGRARVNKRRRGTVRAERRRLAIARYKLGQAVGHEKSPHWLRNMPPVSCIPDRPDRRPTLILFAQVNDAGEELAA